MKNLILAVLAAAAILPALAACRAPEKAPDYGRSREASERHHDSLDKEASGY